MVPEQKAAGCEQQAEHDSELNGRPRTGAWPIKLRTSDALLNPVIHTTLQISMLLSFAKETNIMVQKPT